MKRTYKILSAILALTLVLTSNIIPAMACTLEGADPNAPGWLWNDSKFYYALYRNPYYDRGHTSNSSGGLSLAKGASADSTLTGEYAPAVTEKPVETEPAQRFADVAPGAWYYDAVNTMGLNGILNGCPDGLFHPDDYMTEAEMLTVIYRLATTDEPWKKSGYNGHWAADVFASLHWTRALACYTVTSVAQADDYALRGEANTAIIALLTEANRLSYDRDADTWSSNYYTKVHDWKQDNNPIPDWDVIAAGRPEGTSEWTPHQWFAPRIIAAYNFGLVNGKDTAGTFDPNGHLTRAEFCQMLYNAGITECLHVTMHTCDLGYGG